MIPAYVVQIIFYLFCAVTVIQIFYYLFFFSRLAFYKPISKNISPTHTIEFDKRLTELREAEIDPSRRMADIDRKNNLLQLKW
jgi:hypothetical protein